MVAAAGARCGMIARGLVVVPVTIVVVVVVVFVMKSEQVRKMNVRLCRVVSLTAMRGVRVRQRGGLGDQVARHYGDGDDAAKHRFLAVLRSVAGLGASSNFDWRPMRVRGAKARLALACRLFYRVNVGRLRRKTAQLQRVGEDHGQWGEEQEARTPEFGVADGGCEEPEEGPDDGERSVEVLAGDRRRGVEARHGFVS